MLPVITIVGRPNVGKSTLFNAFLGKRQALVADHSGLTRDRLYGQALLGEKPCLLIDTGGLDEAQGDPLQAAMMVQARLAVEEADLIIWVVDAREGVVSEDKKIADWLRMQEKPIFIAVNKTDGLHAEVAMADFYSFGFGAVFPIAAAHRRGVQYLTEQLAEHLPTVEAQSEVTGTTVAIVGRPNVGKSTLVNRMLGEERVLVYDAPGTTRDSIAIPFERFGEHYTLIDTAGLRRKRSVTEAIEKFSVVKTLQAIEQAQVVLLLLNAREEVSLQDLTIMRLVVEAGRSLVIVVNKWDGLSSEQKHSFKAQLEWRTRFVSFAPVIFISALHGTGVGELYEPIQKVYQSAMQPLSTGNLTRILAKAVFAHQPPLVQGRRIKLRYAHCGGHNPPVIVIHGNQTEDLPQSYLKYLENTYRESLKLTGTPLKVVTKTGKNPFAGKRNKLTPRQMYKRKRLLRHVK